MDNRNKRQLYLYRVTHPEHGTVEVPAEDRLHAVYAAGRAWGVPWTSMARECEIERLHLVEPEPPKQRKASRPPVRGVSAEEPRGTPRPGPGAYPPGDYETGGWRGMQKRANRELTALAAEARRRGVTYDQLVASTTEHQRQEIIERYREKRSRPQKET